MSFSLADVLKDVSDLGTTREQIEYIGLDQVDSDENNFYKLSDLDGLANNIATCGLQQPIRVRRKEDGRYVIVSGHRRRAAIEMLAEDDPEKWRDVACIVEQDEASPALQQLRLIYANANTRTMTSWEISQQAEQVKSLLYRLKEEEGYEFPGRMRDHVAEAVGVSKSKLARLKVIRENLTDKWLERYQENQLNESTAYALAKISPEYQLLIFEGLASANLLAYVYESDVGRYEKRFGQIESLSCSQDCGMPCNNARAKMIKSTAVGLYETFHCDKCCSDCPNLKSCKMACPKLADKVKKLKDDARAAKREEKAAQEAKELPMIQQIQALWTRFGQLRRDSGKTVEDTFKAAKMFYSKSDDKRYTDAERGATKFTTGSTLPYGYSCSLSDVRHLIDLADLFGCSLDTLLCRDFHESSPAEVSWHTVDPANIGGYVLLLNRGNRSLDLRSEVWSWRGDGWYDCGLPYDKDLDGKILGWMPLPEDLGYDN